MPVGPQRHAKGVSLVSPAKVLNVYGRRAPLDELAPSTRAVLDQRVLISSWYPLEVLWDMLDFMYRKMLKQDPATALAAGTAGGREIWSNAHNAFVRDNPTATLKRMGPAWAGYFDFGSLDVQPMPGGQGVHFIVRDYDDVPEVHGMMIAGWHLAAAQLSGQEGAQLDFTALPWRGQGPLRYVITW